MMRSLLTRTADNLLEFFVKHFGFEQNQLVELLTGLDRQTPSAPEGETKYRVIGFNACPEGDMALIEVLKTGTVFYLGGLDPKSPSRNVQTLVDDAKQRGFAVEYSPEKIASDYVASNRFGDAYTHIDASLMLERTVRGFDNAN